jgi:hypothetical protein
MELNYGDILELEDGNSYYVVRYGEFDERSILYEAMLINLNNHKVEFTLEKLTDWVSWINVNNVINIIKI